MIAALFLLATAVAAPVVSRRLTGDVFAPAAIAVCAWAGTLGLLALDLLPYAPLTAGVWWLLAATVAALVTGGLLGQGLAARGEDPAATPALRHPGATVALLALVGLVGVAWYVHAVVSAGGWALFGRGEELRNLLTTYAIPSRYLFLQQVCSAAALVAWAVVLSGARLGVLGTIAAIAAAAGTLTSTDRTQVFTLVLSAGFMYALRRGATLPLARLAAIAVTVPLLLGTAFFAIGAWTGKSAAQVGLRLQIPAGTPGAWTGHLSETVQRGSVAYLYATGSYPALAQLVAAGHPRTHGRHTFYPVLRLLQRTGIAAIDLPPAIPPFVPVFRRADGTSLGTNAYTFLYYPLEDFGPIGAIAYAALVGLGCGWVFGWARRDRASALRLIVAGQVSTALALTFFVNKFNSTAFWYVLAWSALPFAAAEWRARRPSAAAAASRGAAEPALSVPRGPARATSSDD